MRQIVLEGRQDIKTLIQSYPNLFLGGVTLNFSEILKFRVPGYLVTPLKLKRI